MSREIEKQAIELVLAVCESLHSLLQIAEQTISRGEANKSVVRSCN